MRILIADDHPIYAEGLRNLLLSYDYSVDGIVRTGAEAIREALRRRPDVVLMDLNMPEMDGIGATKKIVEQLPETRVIVLTGIEEEESLFRALQAGASGYLLKNLDAEELKRNLEDLASGRTPFSPGLEETLLREFQRGRNAGSGGVPTGEEPLTERQKSILARLAAGRTYKEIGAQLYISERTVKYHIKQIKETLDLDTQAQLISYYHSYLS
ncbi:MAG TPA: response regulator transcription factor [Sediminispirochaeta sp.]|nr:response regulator transcription factor [Sediminispirochaeta sp.]